MYPEIIKFAENKPAIAKVVRIDCRGQRGRAAPHQEERRHKPAAAFTDRPGFLRQRRS